MPLSVTQSVLLPIRSFVVLSRSKLLQLLHRPIPVHFEIDTESTVHGTCWHVDIDVRYPGFDDFVEYVPSLLVVCYSRLDISDTRSESRSHTAGYAILQIWGKLKESVDLASMFIVNLNATSAVRGTGVCLDDYLVQEIIECFVVCLGCIILVSELYLTRQNENGPYLCHAALKSYSTSVMKNALRI